MAPPTLAETAPAQDQDTGPHPGTEAALRKQIEGFEKHQPVTADMTQAMVDTTHQQQATIQLIMDGLGPLQSVVFKGRDERDNDIYLATFRNGALTWSMAPLLGGKIAGIGFSPAVVRSDNGPSPGTQDALRQIIEGYVADSPPYELMMPGTANATRQQLTGLQKMARALGPLKTLTFKKVNPRGSGFL